MTWATCGRLCDNVSFNDPAGLDSCSVVIYLKTFDNFDSRIVYKDGTWNSSKQLSERLWNFNFCVGVLGSSDVFGFVVIDYVMFLNFKIFSSGVQNECGILLYIFLLSVFSSSDRYLWLWGWFYSFKVHVLFWLNFWCLFQAVTGQPVFKCCPIKTKDFQCFYFLLTNNQK